MLVLVTYDVETISSEGRRRLRKIAKICTNYGQRVQNSVFECSITPGQMIDMKKEIEKNINHKKDSIRFYYLGKNWTKRVETMGLDETYNPDEGFLKI